MGSKLYRKGWGYYVLFTFILLTLLSLPGMSMGQKWDHGSGNSITGLWQNVEVNKDSSTSSILNKTISLDLQEITVLSALEAISKKAGLELIYNTIDFKSLNHEVNVNVQDATVEDVLWKTLAETGLRFAITSHKQLLILKNTKDQNSEKLVMDIPQQTISGTVVDAQTGEALPGVNVIVVGSEESTGSTIGTQTDLNGNYSVNVPAGLNLLAFTYIGYQRSELEINGRSTVDVQLQQDVQILDDIVVVGYGVQQEVTVTGAISTVREDEINAVPIGDAASRLQGRVSGVTVTNDYRPGGGSVVRIRGIGSINDNDPLYVVDGVPVRDLAGLNPNDIESMSVLKDASSSAIYGSRAANGVVLITTKRGVYNSPLSVSFDVRYGIQQVQRHLNLLNSEELGQLKWQKLTNDGYRPGDPGWGDLQYGNGPSPVIPDYIFPAGSMEGDVDESLYSYPQPYFGITRANKSGTDWLDEIFTVAPVQEYNLGISGGSAQARYTVSGGLMDNSGILIHSGFSRYNVRANADFDIAKWFDFGQSLGGSYTERRGNSGIGSINEAIRISPILPVYDIQGNFAGTKSPGTSNGQNPVAQQVRSKNDFDHRIRLLSNTYAQINFLEKMSYRTTLGVDLSDSKIRSYELMNPEFTQTNFGNALRESTRRNFQYNWSNAITYSDVISNDHSIDILLATEAVSNRSDDLTAGRASFAFQTVDYMVMDAGEGSRVNSGNYDEWSLFSYFGRINYNYRQKYMLEGVLRRDGSSRFSEENRWGIFPAVSIGWRPLDSSNDVSVISDLKIRVGWGQNGNDNVGNYNQYSTYQSDLFWSYYNISGASSTSSQAGFWRNRIGNEDAKWETNTTTNVGIDASLFNYKLDVTLDIYTRTTSDMLYPNTLPDVMGAASIPAINIGEMRNRGFDIMLAYNAEAGNDWNYGVSFNLSHYKNEVIRLNLDPNEFRYGYIYEGTPYTITKAGIPVSSFYGYIVEGYFNTQQDIDQHPAYNPNEAGVDSYTRLGAFKFKDINGDGIITAEDRTIIGSPHPDFTFGFNVNLQYRNQWDLTIFFQGSYGNDIMNHVKRNVMFSRNDGNYLKERLYESWTPERFANGDKITAPITTNNDDILGRPSTWLLEDGSYLKLKDLQLGYTIPGSFISEIGLNNFRIYLQASNLFIITNYTGLDPELSTGNDLGRGVDGGLYPTPRILTVGLNLNF